MTAATLSDRVQTLLEAAEHGACECCDLAVANCGDVAADVRALEARAERMAGALEVAAHEWDHTHGTGDKVKGPHCTPNGRGICWFKTTVSDGNPYRAALAPAAEKAPDYLAILDARHLESHGVAAEKAQEPKRCTCTPREPHDDDCALMDAAWAKTSTPSSACMDCGQPFPAGTGSICRECGNRRWERDVLHRAPAAPEPERDAYGREVAPGHAGASQPWLPCRECDRRTSNRDTAGRPLCNDCSAQEAMGAPSSAAAGPTGKPWTCGCGAGHTSARECHAAKHPPVCTCDECPVHGGADALTAAAQANGEYDDPPSDPLAQILDGGAANHANDITGDCDAHVVPHTDHRTRFACETCIAESLERTIYSKLRALSADRDRLRAELAKAVEEQARLKEDVAREIRLRDSEGSNYSERLVKMTEERDGLLARVEKLKQDRFDALSVKSRDGLLSSEWLLRTGKAERERDAALAKLAALEALRFGEGPWRQDYVCKPCVDAKSVGDHAKCLRNDDDDCPCDCLVCCREEIQRLALARPAVHLPAQMAELRERLQVSRERILNLAISGGATSDGLRTEAGYIETILRLVPVQHDEQQGGAPAAPATPRQPMPFRPLSPREVMAIAALEGLVAAGERSTSSVVDSAVAMADALLERLAEPEATP